MECPDCHKEIEDNAEVCPNCGFDIAMFNKEFIRIYNEKLNDLNNAEKQINAPKERIVYVNAGNSSGTHKPRCPYCGSENLTRITAADKIVNVALFGIYGNKRRYQWHCNNCKTNW